MLILESTPNAERTPNWALAGQLILSLATKQIAELVKNNASL